jgi:hypothetical protein
MSFIVSFGGDDMGVWTQGFVLARQVLNHLSRMSSPIVTFSYTHKMYFDHIHPPPLPSLVSFP